MNQEELKIVGYNLSFDEVIAYAEDYFFLNKKSIIGRCRMRPLPQSRFIIWRLLYLYEENTLKKIGNYFTNRDHTTILHGVENANMNWLEPDYIEFVEYIIKKNKKLWKAKQTRSLKMKSLNLKKRTKS